MATFTPKIIKCQHGLQCTHFVSHKQGGRIFYRCPLPISDKERCSIFKWDDELSEAENRGSDQHIPPTTSSALPNLPSTPVQGQKRSFNQSFTDDHAQSPSSHKRTRLMEAALKRETEDTLLPMRPQTPLRRLGQRLSFNAGSQPRTPFRASNAEPGPSKHQDDDAPGGSQYTLAGDEAQELDADSVRDLLTKLSDLPDYIIKLERKKLAAERSRDIKAKKIADLEQENANLRIRLEELEELVAILEAES
ncbi:hypothetical protein CPB83DRAFT_852852 [Crepidotus variabilis]|uniref:GRF-type domain-containing protein n=1 Tax=Crepidotus variabilis TaxID=179855 RepID=A0A9P6JQU3_9AGAR|nr:hypothetical protein CPB83DRAFT_852852 [Crepidotus variabilis]